MTEFSGTDGFTWDGEPVLGNAESSFLNLRTTRNPSGDTFVESRDSRYGVKSFTFQGLKDSDVDDFLTFLNSNLGEIVTIRADYIEEVVGIILTPYPNIVANHLGDLYSLSLEIQVTE